MTPLLTGIQEKVEAWQDLPLPSPWEEQHGFAPQVSAKFGVLKLSYMSKIKMLGHRLGEHRDQTKTRETRLIDCYSMRAHCKVEDVNFQLQG